MGRNSRILLIRYFFAGYVKLIRGTPLLAQIYLFFYIIGTAWGIESRFIAGVMILSVFEGAYISEIIRGSYLSMDPDTIQRIVSRTTEEVNKIKDVIPNVIILTSPIVRVYFKKLIDQFLQNITVLSYSEIDSSTQIQSVGSIAL